MSLLLLFRARAHPDATVTATPGILNLSGGTHTAGAHHSVTATPGILALRGGTHSLAYDYSITHTPGILTLVGGTHSVDNGEEQTARLRTMVGTGL